MSSTLPLPDPFAPSTTIASNTSPANSSRPVHLPHIPYLFNDNFLDTLLPPPPAKPVQKKENETAKTSPFMDALHETSNRVLTENDANAYISTNSPTLDLFSGISQATNPSDFDNLLFKSWAEDPLLTVKLIWNLRSIHEGKSAREPFYRAFAWLYRHHPRTAIGNLSQLVEPVIAKPASKKPADDAEATADAELNDEATTPESRGMSHGYYKDLLNILVLATTNQLTTTAEFTSLHVPRTAPDHERRVRAIGIGRNYRPLPRRARKSRHREPTSSPVPADDRKLRDERIIADAREARHIKERQAHAHLLDKLRLDESYHALFIAVARIFARDLGKDLEILKQVAKEETNADERFALSRQISLCGKWAPSLGAFHDRATAICTAISLLLSHNKQIDIELPSQDEMVTQEFAHRIRAMYHRWVIAPLRRFTEIPEIRMSAKNWDKIIYSRVPALCMSNNKRIFFKHDRERFSQFLKDVAGGTRKISGGTLLPHQLLYDLLKLNTKRVGHKVDAEIERVTNEMEVKVLEEQWKSMVQSVKDAGKLGNALAVCDVSGSMGTLGYSTASNPIHPAVALSIVLAQVAEPPWGNCFITFSQNPSIVELDPAVPLSVTANTMSEADWSMNTDFNAVFTRLLLPMAIQNKIKKEDMIKRLFVFSDMEFDAARTGNSAWDTEHDIIKQQFEANGYDLPEIVYWNLQGKGPQPVTKEAEGVALVSGFSPGMLKVFLDEGSPAIGEEEVWEEVVDTDGETKTVSIKKKLDPVETMKKTVAKPSYSGLQLFD